MIKKACAFVIILFCFLSLTGCNNNTTNESNNSVEFEKTSLNTDIPNNNSENTIVSDTPSTAETELSNFSTQIKSKQPGRLNNIRITCSKINEYILENGQEFSFCSTVGKVKAEDGYQKASVIVNKKTIQALGGGNCQVSTTMYNAVMAVPGLTVTERHPHGKKINYVPEGKDAAVSYGSLDFKFKNETGSKIKLYASSDDSNVTIRIVKVEE